MLETKLSDCAVVCRCPGNPKERASKDFQSHRRLELLPCLTREVLVMMDSRQTPVRVGRQVTTSTAMLRPRSSSPEEGATRHPALVVRVRIFPWLAVSGKIRIRAVQLHCGGDCFHRHCGESQIFRK